VTFDPDWVVAPGETLAEVFAERGYDETRVRQLGWIFGIEADQLASVLSGDEPITEQLATKLALMTDVPAHFWLALERNYRVGLAAGKVKVG